MTDITKALADARDALVIYRRYGALLCGYAANAIDALERECVPHPTCAQHNTPAQKSTINRSLDIRAFHGIYHTHMQARKPHK